MCFKCITGNGECYGCDYKKAEEKRYWDSYWENARKLFNEREEKNMREKEKNREVSPYERAEYTKWHNEEKKNREDVSHPVSTEKKITMDRDIESKRDIEKEEISQREIQRNIELERERLQTERMERRERHRLEEIDRVKRLGSAEAIYYRDIQDFPETLNQVQEYVVRYNDLEYKLKYSTRERKWFFGRHGGLVRYVRF